MANLTRRFNQRIPMRDGVTLAADLTLPAELPAPAVVLRTPYGKTGELQNKRAETFAAGGYVAVLVDVRGRGDSDGEFTPYAADGPDGYDVIEWVASQEWCTGAVATWGGSYGGHIQWLAALEKPPSLKAMVTLVTPSDPFVENPTGLPTPMSINWFRLVDARVPQHTDNVDWMSVYAHRPLLTMDEAAGFVSDNWRETLRHSTLDEFWEPHRYQHRIAEVDVPVLHISGWYDDEEIGTPLNFASLVDAGRDGQRLLMGPWGHQVNTTRKLGEVDFGPDALIDLDGVTLAFLDEHVKGESEAVAAPAAPVRIFLMGANEWLDEQSWPPAGAVEQTWWLASEGRANSLFGDGRLVSESGSGSASGASDTWTHDPDRPVPFVTGASSSQIGGPDDYYGVETRGDVLVYTSDVFSEPVDLIGPVRFVGHVSTSAADADVVAMLLDVHPNNFVQRLCDGMVRLRFRDGHRSQSEVRPGESYEIDIAMWDTCHRLLPGHRLRLQITASAFPKHDVNLGTGGDMISETDGVIATQTLWHDAERPSRLVVTALNSVSRPRRRR
jgi:putative CocE/NonD family hydrolase